MNTALINAAEQFRAAYKDGNADTLLGYFDNIFHDALAHLDATPVQPIEPAEPFAKGSWQHAVDDELVGYGKTSEEFASPHEAVKWLLNEVGDAAPQAVQPIPPMSDERIKDLWDAARSDDYDADDGVTFSVRFARALLAEAQKPAQPAMDALPSLDERLFKHAGTDGQLAEDLEAIRQLHWTHWTVLENHTVATAVRVLRELNVWRQASALLAVPQQPQEQPEVHQVSDSVVCGAKSALPSATVGVLGTPADQPKGGA